MQGSNEIDVEELEELSQIRKLYAAGGHIAEVRTYLQNPDGREPASTDTFWRIGSDGERTAGGYPEARDVGALVAKGLLEAEPWEDFRGRKIRKYKPTPAGERWRDKWDEGAQSRGWILSGSHMSD